MDYIILLRPQQWIKNLFLFAPLFFAFDFQSHKIIDVILGFLLFSTTASSIYIFNDYYDIEEDRLHPEKSKRPLASGRVSKISAILIMVFLSCTSLLLSALLNKEFFFILLFYFLLNLVYTIKLKHIPIIDITIISIGFVLRIYSGGVLVHNKVSMWIVLVTFLLALFLAFAKRRDDCLLLLNGKKTRRNIDGYNLEMVNASMVLMAGVTIISYIMYTVSYDVIKKYNTENLYLTSIFVIVGILRYMQITFVEANSGNPTKLVLKDKFLQFILIGWVVTFYFIVRS